MRPPPDAARAGSFGPVWSQAWFPAPHNILPARGVWENVFRLSQHVRSRALETVLWEPFALSGGPSYTVPHPNASPFLYPCAPGSRSGLLLRSRCTRSDVRWRGYERPCAGAAACARLCAGVWVPLPCSLRSSVSASAAPWRGSRSPVSLARVLAARCSVASLPWWSAVLPVCACLWQALRVQAGHARAWRGWRGLACSVVAACPHTPRTSLRSVGVRLVFYWPGCVLPGPAPGPVFPRRHQDSCPWRE